FFQAEDGIRDFHVTGVQTCALPIFRRVTGLMRPSPALTEPLMSSDTPVRSRSPFRRPSTDDGPRASLKQLLPFLLEHKGVLVVVAVLSIVGAVATLAQPLVVGEVIARVQANTGLGALVWIIVALVVAASLISGYQHYLLQR